MHAVQHKMFSTMPVYVPSNNNIATVFTVVKSVQDIEVDLCFGSTVQLILQTLLSIHESKHARCNALPYLASTQTNFSA